MHSEPCSTNPFLSKQDSPSSHVSENIQKDLALLEKAVNYRAWLYSLVQPFVGKRILEVGSGIGNYTDKLLSADYILATDYEEQYTTHLNSRFKVAKNVEVMPLDITKLDAETISMIQKKKIDTVIALNVMEHIADISQCFRHFSAILQPGGVIVVIGPAFQFLFNELDRAYGHYQRHVRSDFKTFAKESSMELIHFRYFNALGAMGWWVNGKLRRKGNLPVRQTQFFDKIVPFLRFTENMIPTPVGLSLLAVLKKS
jgi:SAM-dependent methyltransferase